MRAWLIGIVVVVAVAFLAIVADVMRSHPAIPWFGFGMLSMLFLEAVAYGIVDQIMEKRA